jgi:alpha-mannosidase
MTHALRWTAEKIARRLDLIEPFVYRERSPLPPFQYQALSPTGEIDKTAWTPIAPQTYWSAWQIDFVLRTSFQISSDWIDAAPIALYLPLGEAGDFSHPEALIYLDGQAWAACDRHHQEIRLPDSISVEQTHQLTLHGWTGLGGSMSGSPDDRLLMRPCALVQIDQPLRDFVATARVALGVARHLDENAPAQHALLSALDAAFKRLDTREPIGAALYASVPIAHEALKAGLAQAGAPLDVDVYAAGHAHIDVAWLWTFVQGRRKAARTFHTVLRLMEQFPDYHFTQSQPQLYDFVRRDHPALFAAIRQRVAEGRWEPIGGMWVEADCNLSGAEALARQFMLGRTFFREHFGPHADSRVLWLPDVFGYAWALPQLIKQAGLDYFFTIKIGWNQFNRMPYDTFWWQGLDGTRVLTHFSTTPEAGAPWASTYNAAATPAQIIGTWENFQQKELRQPLLMSFGYGDGGGGPTREMLENVREMAHFPASPRVKSGRVIDFFRETEAACGDQLPTWNGELYLELHRGTYTTQSRTKRANRRTEFALHDAEFLAAFAAQLTGQPYPHDQLRHAWRLTCLNQFHDVLPGSSIGAVYEDALANYAEAQTMAGEVRERALDALLDHVGGDLVIVNPTSFTRSDLAWWPGSLPPDRILRDPAGSLVHTQSSEGGTLIAVNDLPPYSVTPLALFPSPRGRGVGGKGDALEVSTAHLENAVLRVELNSAGDIVRVYDKANRREVLPVGAIANQWQAFEDRPLNWDAWDIDVFYEDKLWLAEPAEAIRVVEAGPLRATLEIKRRILKSAYVQRLSLSYNSPRLDIATTIDWREQHVLLKAAFPVEILASVATHEIQWGSVQRPTHRNTRWDWARFETCAHKWIDLSEGDYGVSLLNDSKYGHDIHDNVLRLSLLRAPTEPDPEADQGEHHFTYSLLPHAGSWETMTQREAYALNDPLLVKMRSTDFEGMKDIILPPSSFILCDSPNIVIETIKQAENGDGIIVRLYEAQRRRGAIALTTAIALRSAWVTNLLEENQRALEVKNQRVELVVRPFEIVTLRLQPA